MRRRPRTLDIVVALALGLLVGACATSANRGSDPPAAPPVSAAPISEALSPSPGAVALTAQATTPEDAWRALLAAMLRGDEPAMARFATSRGIATLPGGTASEPRRAELQRLGTSWAEWPVRWSSRDSDRAEASLGPPVKEHGLTFVRTGEGWKLDRWAPGD